MKTHDERMHELLYDCEGIVEKSERICKLEELVKTALGCVDRSIDCYECRVVAGGCTLRSAMRELGIEAES
jgi:hypothetical protein